MINRIIVVFACVLTAIATNAAGWTDIGTDCSRMRWHYRVQGRPGSEFGLQIAYGDTAVWQTILVRLPANDVDDLFDRLETSLVLSHTTPENKTVTDTIIRVPILTKSREYPELSLKIESRDSTAILKYGETLPAIELHMPVKSRSNIYIRPYNPKKLRVIRNTLKYKLHSSINKSEFSDMDQLERYLASSTDPHEGEWRYYDRSFNDLHVSPRGRYRIATVRNGDGYDIIFLSTDDNIGTRLRQFDIKGRMESSGFDDIYNLTWGDINGDPTDEYASAQFEGDLLTLRFPTYDVMLRFARVKND